MIAGLEPSYAIHRRGVVGHGLERIALAAERYRAGMAPDKHNKRKRSRITPLPTSVSPAPTPFRHALDALASTMGLTDVDSINALFVDWPGIVGEQLAQHCKPRALRDHVLTIEASDQQWATELAWMRPIIAERCNEALGDDAVTEVRILRSKA